MNKSLISNSGAGLPVGFGGVGGLDVGDQLFQALPYVQFISSKGQSFGEVARQIPSIQDGDPILVRAKAATKLNPFRFYLAAAFQHFSMVDTMGCIVKATLDSTVARSDRAWQEHIEALIIVVLDDELVPARCTFKTTKTNAAHTAIKTLREIREEPEEWAKRSPEHKLTVKVPLDWARFTTTVTLKRGTSRSTGFNYVAANGFAEPTGAADWKLLADAMKDDNFNMLCDDTLRRHEQRISEVKQKVV